jgi:hypothetical protein
LRYHQVPAQGVSRKEEEVEEGITMRKRNVFKKTL